MPCHVIGAIADASFPRAACRSVLVVKKSAVATVEQRLEIGETARWEWELEYYDVGLSIVFTPSSNAPPGETAAEEAAPTVVAHAERFEVSLGRRRGEWGPAEAAGTLR